MKPLMKPQDLRHKGWKLRHEDGEPTCLFEDVAQRVWANRLILYVSLVVTLILTFEIERAIT